MVQQPDGTTKKTEVLIDLEWARYLSILDQRVGGVTGTSTVELVEGAFDDAGIEESKAAIYRLRDDSLQNPIAVQDTIESLQSELAHVREQMAELIKVIQDIQQGVSL